LLELLLQVVNAIFISYSLIINSYMTTQLIV